MARNFGTLSIVDTLRVIDDANIMEYGLDRLYDNMNLLLQAHNEITTDIMGFVTRTTDKVRRYGTNLAINDFQEVDEWGGADAQKAGVSGVDVGFPLRRFVRATQWTSTYWEVKTPADFIQQMASLFLGDVINIQRALRRAIFTSTNNLAYIDRFDDLTTLPIRAFLNADGAFIPPDRFGNTFDPATHTHYLATAALTAANVDSLISTLVEHDLEQGENIFIYINKGNEAAFTALAGFQYYEQERVTRGGGYTGDLMEGGTRNDKAVDDVAIGLWDGWVEVWLKPWVPLNYLFAFATGSIIGGGPLIMRQPKFRPAGNLRLMYEHEHHPLTAREWERKFGIGVWGRHKGAAMYTAGGAYVIPTIS